MTNTHDRALHPVRGGMRSGTQNFAPEYDDAGERIRVRTSPRGRTCAACGKPLSVYNPDRICGACDLRAAEPLGADQFGILFEAVCAALDGEALYDELMRAAP